MPTPRKTDLQKRETAFWAAIAERATRKGLKKVREVTGMNEPVVNIRVNAEQIDQVIEKANRLVELLREASDLIDSLSGGSVRTQAFEKHNPS